MAFEWWKFLIKEVEKGDNDCLRRFNGIECTRCQKACKSKAITPSSGDISIARGKCSLCGLCSAACPTEAIKSTFKPYGLLKNGDFIFLCKVSTGEGFSPCLGWLDPGHILNAFLKNGVKKVILSPGSCGKCIPGVAAALKEKVKICQEIAGHFSGDRKILYKPDLVKTFDRKEVMVLVKERVLENVWKEISTHSFFGTANMQKNKLLCAALKGLGKIKEDHIEESFVPWAEIAVDTRKCDYCGICFKLCPSGSLFEYDKENTSYLLQNPSDCSKCGLCIKSCPQKALSYLPLGSLKTFIEKKDIFLVKGRSKRCARCGSTFLDRNGELNCINCRKQESLGLEVRALADTISK